MVHTLGDEMAVKQRLKKETMVTFRTTPEVKRLLERAAEARGLTLSQECEAHVQRSLVQWGSGPTHALMSIIGRTIDDVARLNNAPKWWTDPYQFELAARAVSATFAMFRPRGETPDDVDCRQVDFGRQALLRDVQLADSSKPFERQTVYERWKSQTKRELGSLADLPITFGKSAGEVRDLQALTAPFYDELVELSRKDAASKREQEPGPPLTKSEEARLKELWRKVQEAQS
jgi:hypothetical protein